MSLFDTLLAGIENVDSYSHYIQEDVDNFVLPPELEEQDMFPSMEGLPEPPDINPVAAFKGDDIIILSSGPTVPKWGFTYDLRYGGMKISIKDTNVHNVWGNYAEHSMVAPQTRNLDFEHCPSDAVFLFIDNPTLKALSPIRKGNEDTGASLVHKLGQVAKVARYLGKGQMAFLPMHWSYALALGIFSTRYQVEPPFLFPTEGGCGGLAPFHNPDSLLCMAYHYRKDCRPFLKVMEEVTLINTAGANPLNCLATASCRIANFGTKALEARMQILQGSLPYFGTQSALRAYLREISDVSEAIPPDIQSKAVIIRQNNYLQGVTLGALKRRGLIYTATDVQKMTESGQRVAAVLGRTPIQEVLDQKEYLQKKWRSTSVRALITLLGNEQNDPLISAYVRDFPDPATDLRRCREIVRAYYWLHLEGGDWLTSLSNTAEIECYPISALASIEGNGSTSILGEIILEEFDESMANRIVAERRVMTFDRQIESEQVLNWADNLSGANWFTEPMPVGAGPDDARILQELSRVLEDIRLHAEKTVYFAVVTNDATLMAYLRGIVESLHESERLRLCVRQWRVSDYLGSIQGSVIRPARNRRPPLQVFDILRGMERPLPRDIDVQIRNDFDASCYMFVYDVPNIEKFLQPYSVDRHAQIVGNPTTVKTGGYVSQHTAIRLHQESQTLFALDFKGLRGLIQPLAGRTDLNYQARKPRNPRQSRFRTVLELSENLCSLYE